MLQESPTHSKGVQTVGAQISSKSEFSSSNSEYLCRGSAFTLLHPRVSVRMFKKCKQVSEPEEGGRVENIGERWPLTRTN